MTAIRTTKLPSGEAVPVLGLGTWKMGEDNRRHAEEEAALKLGKARALLVNAGNANAFTGKAGTATVKAVAAAASKAFKSKPGTIYQASTGVIGEPLDPSFIVNAIPELTKAAVADGWDMAARAIMTTDTFPKVSTRTVKLDGRSVTINGIAKGSGMIAPNMATMLAFVFTDAALSAPILEMGEEQVRVADCRRIRDPLVAVR